ncbi:MAG: YHS domain-containing protein [Candidatus Omnitrophica bacterium]|nr:YHS domain-containing protein [Candidatus Omnitrophota bacterium]
MKRTIVAGLLLALFMLPAAYALVAVDAGNARCPVSGDKVSGKHFVEHDGKTYGLCCAMCKGKFTKNPEKYLAQMKSDKESGEESHEGHDHSM